mmetsp:Transcript_48472/g.154819  ORF Transcript_48472/g.154819 Transcript_48472/m.154819 type:complete len:416 (+) Transcript_48472:28-1275(+)
MRTALVHLPLLFLLQICDVKDSSKERQTVQEVKPGSMPSPTGTMLTLERDPLFCRGAQFSHPQSQCNLFCSTTSLRTRAAPCLISASSPSEHASSAAMTQSLPASASWGIAAKTARRTSACQSSNRSHRAAIAVESPWHATLTIAFTAATRTRQFLSCKDAITAAVAAMSPRCAMFANASTAAPLTSLSRSRRHLRSATETRSSPLWATLPRVATASPLTSSSKSAKRASRAETVPSSPSSATSARASATERRTSPIGSSSRLRSRAVARLSPRMAARLRAKTADLLAGASWWSRPSSRSSLTSSETASTATPSSLQGVSCSLPSRTAVPTQSFWRMGAICHFSQTFCFKSWMQLFGSMSSSKSSPAMLRNKTWTVAGDIKANRYGLVKPGGTMKETERLFALSVPHPNTRLTQA